MNLMRINIAVIMADIAGLIALGMAIKPSSLMALALACTVLCGLYAVYTHLRPDEKIRDAAAQVLGLVIFSHAAAVLSYLVVTTDAPLADATFAKIDAWLGFDWPTWFAYVDSSRGLTRILALAYASTLPQIALVAVFLSFSGRLPDARRFSLNVAISCLLTIAISGFVPAAGAWVRYGASGHIDASMLSHFELLRHHHLRVIDLARMQGLISMPSFHTVLSLLLVHAVRTSKSMLALLLPLNALVLLSTLSEGGHYLSDVLGGIVVAIGTIAATHWLQRHGMVVAGHHHVPSTPQTAGNMDRAAGYTLD